MVVSHVLDNESVKDDDVFQAELDIFEEIGFNKFLNRHKVSMKTLCNYFTRNLGTIKPITAIEVR